MRLNWSMEAQYDLSAIRSYIDLRNPAAASHVAGEIIRTAMRLEMFPLLGRASNQTEIRLLQVPRLPYLIPYRIDGETIEILAVFDERQERPPEWA